MKPLPLPLKDLLQRIESKMEKTASCWLWQGPCHNGTTPILRIPHSNKVVAVRRVLILASGIEIPPRFRVFPTTEACKQWVCIRPEHMQVTRGVWPEQVKKFRKPRQYSEAMISQACELYYEGKTQREVAALTGIEYTMVSRLVRGLRHSDVTKLPRSPGKVFLSRSREATSGEKSHFSKITEGQALKIVAMAEDGRSPRDISELVGCSRRIVMHVLNGDAWRWLTKRRVPISEYVDPKTRDGWYRPVGEKHPRSSLTIQKVLTIVTFWNAGQTIADIAREVGATYNTVYGVVHGKSWAWLTGISPEVYRHGPHWNNLVTPVLPEYVTKAITLANQGMTYTKIADILGKSISTISRIVREKTWSKIGSTNSELSLDSHRDAALVYQYWKGGRTG